MGSKDVRNAIITLIILAVGVKVISMVSKGFVPPTSVPTSFDIQSLMASVDTISNLLVLGIAVIILILIPVYFSKRSSEKKIQAMPQQRPPEQ